MNYVGVIMARKDTEGWDDVTLLKISLKGPSKLFKRFEGAFKNF